MAGGRVHGSSKFSLLLPTQTSPSLSSHPLDSLFLSGSSSSSFLGSSSMVSFEDANKSKRASGSFFRTFDLDDNCDEDFDEYFNQSGKKRRLTVDQVQFLEKSFEVENKLEPDRKIQLAKDLNLQPRQIAIWFQNRRARWKTKQMEKDYDVLQSSYDSLKANYENLLKEKENLKAEVLSLSEQLINKEKEKQYLGISDLNRNACNSYGLPDSQIANSVSEGSESKLSNIASKQEGFTSAKSDILDSSGSPNYATDGGVSPHLDHADSSCAFEPDPSDGSQDEEEAFLPILAYLFPKLEDSDYSNLPTSSCNFAFPVEDQAIWSWSY